jgi:peroxiredoxin
MHLRDGQALPVLQVTDVTGNIISLMGEKTFLSFQRNAGCPICNFHVHELIKHAPAFERQQIQVVLVYESSKENLLEYLHQEKLPFAFVADPSRQLYNLFGVERSLFLFLKGLLRGGLTKAIKGKSLFKTKIKIDGDTDRIGADFLLQKGMIEKTHYGAFVGNHLTSDTILSHFKN